MSVYTRRLGAGDSNVAQNVLLYTVQPTESVVVRDIVFALVGGAAARFYIFVKIPGPHYVRLWDVTLEPDTSQHLELRQSMVAGDELHLQLPLATTSWSVTGYLFSV